MTNAMQEYTEANVAGAGQLKLIIMLYEGARRFLLQAHDCIEKKQTMEAHEYLIKAKRIIVHFLCTTNPESSELAANLHKLYVFLYEKIARANMCKSLEETEAALFIKIEVPMESLLSHEYRDIMRLLHEVVADIEQEVIRTGYVKAKGFAGGSCKELFCGAYTDCNVLERKSDCRNPGRSRPSMSGFGVNVTKLKEIADWNQAAHMEIGQGEEQPLGAVYGLVLVG